MGSSDDIRGKIVSIYTYIFTAACITLTSILYLSFILGGYTVFNTQLGFKEVDTPISRLPLFIFGVPVPLVSNVTVGDMFSALWMIYLLIFTVAFNGPRRSLIGVLKALKGRNRVTIYDNTLLTVVTVFSILIVVVHAVELIQMSSGVPTGSLPEGKPILTFTMISLAPLVEEVGFRLTLIGGVAFLILLGRTGEFLGSLKALCHPSKHLEAHLKRIEYQPLMYIMIVLTGVFFGVAHIAFGSGWAVGKLSTATISGVVLGWVYYRQGFPAAILLHWAFNYPAGAYVYFACGLSGAELCTQIAEESPIVSYLDSSILFTGVLSIGMILLNRYGGAVEEGSQPVEVSPHQPS